MDMVMHLSQNRESQVRTAMMRTPRYTPDLFVLKGHLPVLLIKMVMGLRVSEEEEYEGVDVSECGLEAYPEFAAVK